jgi:hypothetical protein
MALPSRHARHAVQDHPRKRVGQDSPKRPGAVLAQSRVIGIGAPTVDRAALKRDSSRLYILGLVAAASLAVASGGAVGSFLASTSTGFVAHSGHPPDVAIAGRFIDGDQDLHAILTRLDHRERRRL